METKADRSDRSRAYVLRALLGVLLSTLVIPRAPAAPQQQPVNGVTVQYWSRPTAPNPPNRHLSWPIFIGDPTPTWVASSLPMLITERIEPNIDNDWAALSPIPGVVPIDDFMVVYTGFIQPPQSGTYMFSTRTDDGVRLWINNRFNFPLGAAPNYNYWVDQGATVRNGTTVNLDSGFFYPFRMEMYERGGSAVSQLRWRLPGTTVDVIIPSSAFFTQPAGPVAPESPPEEAVAGGDHENDNGDNSLLETCGGSIGAFRFGLVGLLAIPAAGVLFLRRRKRPDVNPT